MKTSSVAFTGPREVDIVQEDAQPLGAAEVRVRTLYSGISTGTELTAYRGTNPYMHKQWDENRRLFVNSAERASIEYPVLGWGYEEVGEVIEVGPDARDIHASSVVYGTWGHRETRILTAQYARDRILRDDVDPVFGIFSQIGAIALNGVLDAGIRLGEVVAVFGLGVVGQLVGQLAKLSGAEVIGVDLLPLRLDKARAIGLDHVIDGRDDAVEQIRALTDGRGADICIEASGSPRALHEAVRACAYSARVVAMGFFQGDATGLFLGEEFHHNRINIVCSQISGVAPELQYRWSENRLVHTFMSLVEHGRLQLEPLITHVVAAREARALFELLDERPHEVLQAVLDFRDGMQKPATF